MDDKTFEIVETVTKLPRVKRKEDGFNRMDVVNAFNNAFQMIGGVPRLALWANQNPDKFYPLYARLMPSTSVNITAEGTTLVIEHATPTTGLDDFADLLKQQEQAHGN
jgi:hypothetical protein